MSTDGMMPEPIMGNQQHTSVTTETEEEYAVIEEGQDYKLSIMRKKRPIIKEIINEDEKSDHEFHHFPRFREEDGTTTT